MSVGYICAFCDNAMFPAIGFCETCDRVDGALTVDEWVEREVALAVWRAGQHA